ncbi:hypothetical protein BASA81_010036 [Batrachochytrium salamandrivorans]|nr:hypothetical protein BASA81_010036 [Batrachochytrium salamandrivorans]
MDGLPLLDQSSASTPTTSGAGGNVETIWTLTPTSTCCSSLSNSSLYLHSGNAFTGQVDFEICKPGRYWLDFNLVASSKLLATLCASGSVNVVVERPNQPSHRFRLTSLYWVELQVEGTSSTKVRIIISSSKCQLLLLNQSYHVLLALKTFANPRSEPLGKQDDHLALQDSSHDSGQDFSEFLRTYAHPTATFLHNNVKLPFGNGEGGTLLPRLKTRLGRLVDSSHRDVILRGVNLSGNSKCPIGWATHLSPFPAEPITFVGRPFPLAEADSHFARLQSWGFNCLRFIFTWEAIEHQGPDVWSRFTGGSGAPLWTLELAGLDVSQLVSTEACFTHHSKQDELHKMMWPQNYQRFACLHMFTLFFSGKEFAPEWMVNEQWQPGLATAVPQGTTGKHITDFLQDCYFASIHEVAKRVAKYPNVLGFDSFNEPSSGFVGKDLGRHPETIIPPGVVFRPVDAMATASGVSLRLSVSNALGGITPLKKQRVNATHASIWSTKGAGDVWQTMGIWTPNTNHTAYELHSPNYFTHNLRNPGQQYNFFRDFLAPFAARFLAQIRTLKPEWMIFVEGDAFGHTDFYWTAGNNDGVVNASHWYDGFTLFMGHFNAHWTVNTDTRLPIVGHANVVDFHLKVLEKRKRMPRDAQERAIALPLLVGEFGLPFDLNHKKMLHSGDFSPAVQAMSMYYSIFDVLEIGSMQWNYSVENSDEFGDMWNRENLSIFAHGQGRGVQGFSRPFAPVVCGQRLYAMPKAL